MTAGAGRGRRQRRARRILGFPVTSPFSLPVVGAAAVAAVAVGLHLGNSAVAEINPLYFRGPAVHPRDRGAAIDETALQAQLARRPPRYDQLYGWDEGQAARGALCRDCGLDDGARVYAAAVPYFGSVEEIRAEDAAERRELNRRHERRLADAAEREARSKAVLRYVDFPLTDEEEAAAVRAVAAAVDQSDPMIDD